jgi:Flp pilus assembly protein TadG
MRCRDQLGAFYVEAAIVMPLLLLVVFVSIFFCTMAVRNFALQMLANDIARDISLALGTFPTTANKCIFSGTNPCAAPTAQNTKPFYLTDADYKTARQDCWNSCAGTQYLLADMVSSGTISITGTTIPSAFDTSTAPSTSTTVVPGDLIKVKVSYPASRILNGGQIPLFGSVTATLQASAVTVMEKP